VFRDELVNLFPEDPNAQRLARQSFLLAEFLRKVVPGYKPRHIAQRTLLHGHCHHKAIATIEDEEALMRDVSADVGVLDAGCCGMPGSFGFEGNHCDMSMQVGELVLLPAVREAPVDTLIIADGFSCREQIAHGTGRRAVHLAQALQMALVDASAVGVRPSKMASCRLEGLNSGRASSLRQR